MRAQLRPADPKVFEEDPRSPPLLPKLSPSPPPVLGLLLCRPRCSCLQESGEVAMFLMGGTSPMGPLSSMACVPFSLTYILHCSVGCQNEWFVLLREWTLLSLVSLQTATDRLLKFPSHMSTNLHLGCLRGCRSGCRCWCPEPLTAHTSCLIRKVISVLAEC